jgi:hypothetical protein
MPIWAAWLGWILTVGQAIWRFVQWRESNVKRSHLRAVRDDVRALRDACSETLKAGEVCAGPAERQWVRRIDDGLQAIENHIGAALGGSSPPKRRAL